MTRPEATIDVSAVGIDGFKSFSGFSMPLKRLTVLIGSNGAGKTNFLEALDLITSVYRVGLDEALDEFGGFNAIARRSEAGLADTMTLAVDARVELSEVSYAIRHEFSVRSADHLGRFSVDGEYLTIASGEPSATLMIARSSSGSLRTDLAHGAGEPPVDALREINDSVAALAVRKMSIDETRLFLPSIAPFSGLISSFSDGLARTRSFEVDAALARDESDRSHRPDMSRYGEQLPSFLEWLREVHPAAFGRVEGGLRDMMPSLSNLKVVETQPGVRAVQFEMERGPSPLYTQSVSDGTMKYLVLLAALNDPRSSLLLLEEPENSLHPWLINRLAESIEEASRDKLIVLTSHSPQIMRALPIESLYVAWNADNTSHTRPLKSLAPELVEAWESGELNVFDVVDSGAITEYLPQYGE